MKSLIALLSALALAAPASAAVTVYTNRAAWEAAVSSSVLVTESFDALPDGTANFATGFASGMTIVTGSGTISPQGWSDIGQGKGLVCEALGAVGVVASFTIETGFPGQVAFGFDYADVVAPEGDYDPGYSGAEAWLRYGVSYHWLPYTGGFFNDVTPDDFAFFGIVASAPSDIPDGRVLFGKGDGTFTIDRLAYAVPEPGPALLVVMAAGIMGLSRRRRHDTAQAAKPSGMSAVCGRCRFAQCLIIGWAGILTAVSCAQVPDTLKHTLPLNLSVGQGAKFGSSLAAGNGLIAVGAYTEGSLANGSVRLFDAATGALWQHLWHPAGREAAYFGTSLAMSGTRLVVGAPGDSPLWSGSGSIVIYDLASPDPAVPVRVIENPFPSVADAFGHSVSISGTRVAVGCPMDDEVGNDAGSVYVYDLSSPTSETPVLTLHNPDPFVPLGALFGNKVALSGSRLVVKSSGKVHVYDLDQPDPASSSLSLVAPDLEYGGFTSVAISGSRVVAGFMREEALQYYHGVYSYDLAGPAPTWPVREFRSPDPYVVDRFGQSVAISGNRVVVGAYNHDGVAADSVGRAYLYDLDGGSQPAAVYENPRPDFDDRFGHEVAVSAGEVLVGSINDSAGAPGGGLAHVFASNPASPYHLAAGAAGLAMEDADTDGSPFADGVPNVLKFAFNLNLAAADRRMMVPGGTAGLPHLSRVAGEPASFRIEYLRRIGAGLDYVPEVGSTLAAEGWVPMPGAPQVTPIDVIWERVVHEMPATGERLFGRVRVELQP